MQLMDEIRSENGANILSLFDGMACGMLAMQRAGIEVDRYVAFEIDKYAVQTSAHNFPMIEHGGDVFKADFTEFAGFDYLVGGSPCTYWSIAQKNNRETEASGMGWELFSQYVRALHEAKPRFFIYENNKSMSKAIRESITGTFGFEPVCINSALVSAQNRNRLYWVGRRNEDGTYSKVNVDQPEDRGILLKDILETGCDLTTRDKGWSLTASYDGRFEARTDGKSGTLTGAMRQNTVAEPVGTTKDGKSFCLTAGYANGSGEKIGNYAAHTLEKGCKSMVEEPVCVAQRGRYTENGIDQHYEAREDGKTNVLTIVQKDNNACESVRIGCYPSPDGTLKNSQGMRLYSIDGKSVNMTAQGGGLGAKTGLYALPTPMYATPCEWDDTGNPTKAISAADGKAYLVYPVVGGEITIKGKKYPIKLIDGYYIIRKLTVKECMRLQTVPEWYEFPVSDSQAYKMLGNGWTVDVIAHILKGIK